MTTPPLKCPVDGCPGIVRVVIDWASEVRDISCSNDRNDHRWYDDGSPMPERWSVCAGCGRTAEWIENRAAYHCCACEDEEER